MNAALVSKGSKERVDHRSFKARGIAKHPTKHAGKKGTAAEGRSRLNSRSRNKNAQAMALEEQIRKLMRMPARLAARNLLLANTTAVSAPGPDVLITVCKENVVRNQPVSRRRP